MPDHKSVNVFYEQSGAVISPKLVGLAWTAGPWISKHYELSRYATLAYVLGGTPPATLQAKVEVSSDNGVTSHGSIPVVVSIAGGGIVTIADGIFQLPVTAGYHRFDFHVRTGLVFRVSFIRTVGAGDTSVLAHVDLDVLP